MSRRQDLGRVAGVFVAVEEVEILLVNGWTLADDLADDASARGIALMTPPDTADQEAA